MIRPLLRLSGAAAAVATIVAFASVPATSESVAVYSIQTGRSIVLKTPALERVAVGDSRIAGIVPLGTSEVVVNGKSPGHTTIFIWMNGVRKTYEFTVTDQNLDAVAGILRGHVLSNQVDQAIADNDLKTWILAQQADDQKKWGIDATPSFVVNGKMYSGEMSFDAFRKLIPDS